MGAINIQEQGRPAIANVPVARIKFHPRNIRQGLGDLRELAASLRAEGMLQPVLLHRYGRIVEVVDGHRRVAAAKLAGLKAVPAMVIDELDDDEVIHKALATGLLKRGINNDERRQAVVALVEEFGHTQAAVAERLGVSAATVSLWCSAARQAAEQAGEDGEHQAEPTAPGADAQAPATGRRAARKPRVTKARRVEAVLESWTEHAQNGLSAAEATQLLEELRAIVTPAAATTSTSDTTAGDTDSAVESVGAEAEAA